MTPASVRLRKTRLSGWRAHGRGCRGGGRDSREHFGGGAILSVDGAGGYLDLYNLF